MEGENQVLCSSYWIAQKKVEITLTEHVDHEDPIIANMRRLMFADWNINRIPFESAITKPLFVIMHLLDPRHARRRQFLFTEAQWNDVVIVFRNICSKFFPNDCLEPIWTSLTPEVQRSQRELFPAPPAAAAPAPPLIDKKEGWFHVLCCYFC